MQCSLILSIVCTLALFGAEPIAIKTLIQEAELYNGQNVILQGFIYRSNAGSLIISSEPNLKSCCIGVNKKYDQILVESANIIESKFIQKVQGTFMKKDGNLHLVNASAMRSTNNKIPFRTIATAVFLMGLFLLFFRNIRRTP